MYEVDKIKEIIEQTEKQKEMILRAESLEERMDYIQKTIASYDLFIFTIETKLGDDLLSEDKEKLAILKENINEFVELLKQLQRELTDIKNNFRFVSQKDYDERLQYSANLIKFQDVSQKLKWIEKNSKKLAKKRISASFETLISAEGRKKLIFEADVLEYKALTEEKIRLNKLLKQQYPRIVKNYDKETNLRKSYVEVTERVNLIESIPETEKKPENLNKLNQPKNIPLDKWLENKNKFKNYLVQSLHITDSNVLNKLLNYYDAGLEYNIDFKMDMFSLGYPMDAVDYITNKYDSGPKPFVLDDTYKIKPKAPKIFEELEEKLEEEKATPKKKKGKIISFVKKRTNESSKKNIKKNLETVSVFAASILLVVTCTMVKTKTSKPIITTDVQKDSVVSQDEFLLPNNNSESAILGFDYQTNQVLDLFEENFTVTSDANIYSNMYDAHDDNNKIEPYYNNTTPRKVKAIVMVLNNQLIYVNNQNDYEKYLKLGAVPNSVLSSIDDFTEGFCRFEDTSINRRGHSR